ncbi:MAG TPA: HIT domain-containing protein [Terriglobia bacterium]|jgi:ATP adenylyltransferase|nr:HIT domain-containing protein [Terriglobia bacterium]
MDYLWTPWRFHYVSKGAQPDGCIFCEKAAADPAKDREYLVLYRGRNNYVILNLFPYTVGHAMIVPYAHVADLIETPADTLAEMMTIAQRFQRALKEVYHPEGYNLGMNIGRCAGAGVEFHVHMHILPRWIGDSNFMTVVGETRVEPENLTATYDKLAGYFRK